MRLNGNLVLNSDGLSEIQNAIFERVAALPTVKASEKGRFVFVTGESKVYFNDGIQWSALATGGNAAALQTEVDALESALGSFFTAAGGFDSAALSSMANIVGTAGSLTEVIGLINTAIGSVKSDLASETSRATTAEAGLQSAIDAEASRATTAEAGLQSAIDAEAAARSSADTTLQGNIDAEATARAAADTTLTNALAAEVTRATGAEGTLTTNLGAEVTRATAAEAGLQSAIDAEVSRAESAEVQLTSDLAAEVTRATAAEATLQATMDQKLAGLTWKNSVKVLSDSNIESLSGLLTIDGVTLAEGDRVLVNGQTAPADNGVWVASVGNWTRAEDMDATTPLNEFNSAAVFVELGTQYHDTGWTEVLAVSTIGEDPVQFTQFNGAAGITAGDGLDKSGNTLLVKADGSTITVTAAGVKVADSVIASISANGSAISSEAAARTAADTTLQGNIDAEATRAQAAETALGNSVTAETSRATTAEAGLQAAIDAEVTRAQGVEADLQSELDAEVVRATAAEGVLTTDVAAINTKLGKIYFKYEAGSATPSHVVAHNLGQQFGVVTVIDSATKEVIIPQSIVFDSANQLTVTLNAALAITVVVVAVGF